MHLKQKILSILCLLATLACSDDNGSYSQAPAGTAHDAGIYPVPPDQWVGETDPYYASGYAGDVMPFYDNGKFYLYFLHDAKTKPAGQGFHDIHSFETADLTSFGYNGRAIPYGAYDEPDFAIGTGSVVKKGNTYFFYYTGHNGNTPYVQEHPRESVLCATSTDLKHWTKIPEFRLTAPEGYYDYEFRDPHVFFNEEAGEYWMLVSTQTEPGRKAVVLLFTASDPTSNDWQVGTPVYTTTSQEDFLMLECADMFKMGAYWYLIFSENWSEYKGTRYRMATSPRGPWTTPETDRFDGEYLYAAKTATDGSERYLFGWTARKTPENNGGEKDWAGNMVVHHLVQNTDGTLSIRQPETVEHIFVNEEDVPVQTTSGEVSRTDGTITLNGTPGTAMVTFGHLKNTGHIHFSVSLPPDGNTGIWLSQATENDSGFRIVLEPENNRLAAYMVDNGNETLVNRIPFTFTGGQEHRISLTINNDVCVLYIDHKMAFSNRIYDIAGNNWSLFSTGGQAVVSGLHLKSMY